jgi:hypothetical protein
VNCFDADKSERLFCVPNLRSVFGWDFPEEPVRGERVMIVGDVRRIREENVGDNRSLREVAGRVSMYLFICRVCVGASE